VRAPDGAITAFDPDGSIQTDATAINSKDEVTGKYELSEGVSHGFLRKTDGTIVSFDAPMGFAGTTQGIDINDKGEIIGSHLALTDGYVEPHGFRRRAFGKITTIEPKGVDWSSANGINTSGQITGSYGDSQASGYGYLYTP